MDTKVTKIHAPQYEVSMRMTGREAAALAALMRRVGGNDEELRMMWVGLAQALRVGDVPDEHESFVCESGGPGAVYFNKRPK